MFILQNLFFLQIKYAETEMEEKYMCERCAVIKKRMLFSV